LYPALSKSSFAVVIGFLDTFSAKTNVGSTSRTILNICPHKSFSAMFLPLAALENAWQGNPPETKSTVPFHGLPSKVQMSPHIGKLGRVLSFCLCTSTC